MRHKKKDVGYRYALHTRTQTPRHLHWYTHINGFTQTHTHTHEKTLYGNLKEAPALTHTPHPRGARPLTPSFSQEEGRTLLLVFATCAFQIVTVSPAKERGEHCLPDNPAVSVHPAG